MLGLKLIHVSKRGHRCQFQDLTHWDLATHISVNWTNYKKTQSHWAYDHVTTYIRPQNKTNHRHRAIDLRVIVRANLVAAGRWSCSKLWTDDYKFQEVANRSYMIAQPVVQSRTINRAWSGANNSRDWSCDWLGDHSIDRAICGTVSRLVVRSITISDDWLHDLKIGSKITLDNCMVQERLESLLENTVLCQILLNLRPISCKFRVILVRRLLGSMLLVLEFEWLYIG